MKQNLKEQVLKTALGDGDEGRCRRAFFSTYAASGATMDLDEPFDYAQWIGWQAAWRFLQREYEAYVRS